MNFDILKLLIKQKANVNALNLKGNTPLSLVCGNEILDFESIQFLVENNAQLNLINTEGNLQKKTVSALHKLCANKKINLKVIEYLVEKKSNLNCPDLSNSIITNNTPLHYACQNHYTNHQVIHYLIKKKADFNLQNTHTQIKNSHLTPLQLALSNIKLVEQIQKVYGKGVQEFFEQCQKEESLENDICFIL